MHKILIIDDEKDICFLISEILNDQKFLTKSALNSKDAIKFFNDFQPDLVILDVWLSNSDLDGIQLLKKFKQLNSSIPIIIISGHGNIDMAVNCIKNGAYDFLEKPFNSEKLIILSNRAIENAKLIKENNYLKKSNNTKSEIVGESKFILEIKKNLKKISQSNSRILITGAIGSGKKLFAKSIHNLSNYKDSLANILDFSSLDKDQMSEVFEINYKSINTNIFVNSNKTSLICENINKSSLESQKKLLFLLENPEKLEGYNVHIDLKFISLSSENLSNLVDQNKFNKDLYYRLNVIPIHIPSIKDRREDIIPLCNYFLNKFNNYKTKVFLSKNAQNKLENYEWPGNVRQISNYIERILILNQNMISKSDTEITKLPEDIEQISAKSQYKFDSGIKEAREKFEKDYFLSQIKRFNGNISKISEFTGMERTALYRKLKILNIDINKT